MSTNYSAFIPAFSHASAHMAMPWLGVTPVKIPGTVIFSDTKADYPSPQGRLPDNRTTVTPMQRIPKIDFANALSIVFGNIGLANNLFNPTFAKDAWKVFFVTEGTFHQSMIRNTQYAGRTVIVVGHGEESDTPSGVGNYLGAFEAAQMSAPGDTPGSTPIHIPDDTLVNVAGTRVRTEVDVSIFDIDPNTINRVHALLGSVMRNVIQTALMDECGYIEIRQTGHSEATNVFQPEQGSPFPVYQRDRHYMAVWQDVIYSVDTLANIVAQIMTVDTFDGVATDERLMTQVNS